MYRYRGGQQRSLRTAHVAGGAGQSCGEGSGAQHEVEGVERVVGGGWHKRIDNDCFFKHYWQQRNH